MWSVFQIGLKILQMSPKGGKGLSTEADRRPCTLTIARGYGLQMQEGGEFSDFVLFYGTYCDLNLEPCAC